MFSDGLIHMSSFALICFFFNLLSRVSYFVKVDNKTKNYLTCLPFTVALGASSILPKYPENVASSVIDILITALSL